MQLDPYDKKLLESLQKNAHLKQEDARSTPPGVFTSSGLLELELNQIFSRAWVCAGREDEFKEPGDFRTITIGRDPVIVLRDHHCELRAMSNVCRHRLMTLLVGEGKLPHRITCPYHSWTYELDGCLAGAGYMPADFGRQNCRLPQFLVEIWEGWVYVNLDQNASPLAPRLTPISRLCKNFRLPDYQTLFRVEETWDTNWKILVENFMDGYHLFSVHNKTVEHALPTRLCEVLEGGPGFNLYKQGRIPGVAYEHSMPMSKTNSKLTEEEQNTVYLFCVFPCHVVSISPERTFWMSLQPISVDKVKVLWGVDVFSASLPDNTEMEKHIMELKKSFTAINEEDKPIVSAIAKNASALAAESNRLSSKEGTIWNFQRYLVDQMQNIVSKNNIGTDGL